MAGIQNIGPLLKSTILGFTKGWRTKRGLTSRPNTKKNWKMLRIIWLGLPVYSSNSYEPSLGKGHLVSS
jgi:hypothetical protein